LTLIEATLLMGCVLVRARLRTGTKDEEIGTDSYFKDASGKQEKPFTMHDSIQQ
jgi:hypothetical protein